MTVSYRKNVLFIFFWLLVFISEYYLFKNYISYNVAKIFPVAHDQSNYLRFMYDAYENINRSGLLIGLANSFTVHTGVIYIYEGLLLTFLLGPSRLTALTVNFLYFISLQISFYLIVRSLTKNIIVPLFFIGLLLMMRSPYNVVGGLFDFRLDFVAFCLYGIFVGLSIKSDFFLKTKWSYLAAGIGILTILNRTLTFVYLMAILCLFLVYLLYFRSQIGPGNFLKNQMNVRIKNIIKIVTMILLTGLMILWWKRLKLYEYYVVGHVLGNESAIRKLVMGLNNWSATLLYYPNSILFSHMGDTCLSVICILFVYMFLHAIWLNMSDKIKTSSQLQQNPSIKLGFIFLFISIFFPFLVLSVDNAKSPVVGNIIAITIIWLVIWFLIYMNRRAQGRLCKNIIFISLTSVALVLGVMNLYNSFKYRISIKERADFYNITRMYKDLGKYAVAQNKSKLFIAIDEIQDYLAYNAIFTINYENKGLYVDFKSSALGKTIFAIDFKGVQGGLEEADVLIVRKDSLLKGNSFPFDKSVNLYKDYIYKYAIKHFNLLSEYRFKNISYTVYVK